MVRLIRRLGEPRAPAWRLRDPVAVRAMIAAHWLAYPAEDRFLVGAYLLILIAAAAAVARPTPSRAAPGQPRWA